MFFLQMSGFPGSGKSTLAKEIARHLDVVIIDHDVSKTALLQACPVDYTNQLGSVAYEIDWAMVEFQLALGRNVILDSPCLYDVMLKRGIALATTYGATYRFIDCVVEDVERINHRLATRSRRPSQIAFIAPEHYSNAVLATKRPSTHPILELDTSQPVSRYIEKALTYLSSSLSR